MGKYPYTQVGNYPKGPMGKRPFVQIPTNTKTQMCKCENAHCVVNKHIATKKLSCTNANFA